MGGHLKIRGSVSWQDDASLYRLAGTGAYFDASGELRLKNTLFFTDQLSLETHYEALVSGGDTRRKTAEIQNRLPGFAEIISGMNGLSDDRRFLDLTSVIDRDEAWLSYHRLDRLSLKYLPEWGAVSVMAERLGRGELFTLGRYYLAGEIQAELHPLFNIFLTCITNLADRSVIVQPRAAWNFAQNLEVIFGAQLYAGETGSEFGGVTIPGTDFVYKSPDSVFAWVTWYF